MELTPTITATSQRFAPSAGESVDQTAPTWSPASGGPVPGQGSRSQTAGRYRAEGRYEVLSGSVRNVTRDRPSPRPGSKEEYRMHNMQATQKPLSRQFIAVIRLLVLVAVASAVLLFLMGDTGAEADAPVAAPVTYRVDPGDTLWEIAEPHTAPGGDVRETVRQLLDLNNLDGADLQPGQVLLVPAT